MQIELQELAESVVFNARFNHSTTKEELMEHGLTRTKEGVAEIEARTKARILQAFGGEIGGEIIWTQHEGYYVACVLDLYDCEHCRTYKNRNIWFYCLEDAIKQWTQEFYR